MKKNVNFNLNKYNNIINITEFNRIFNMKQLKSTLNVVFNSKQNNNNTLYLLDYDNNFDEGYLREFLFFQGEKAIYLWKHGLVTNFAEVLKHYLSDSDNKLQANIFDIRWSELTTIFLTKVPGRNSSMLKELKLLKQTLNVKVVAFVDINNNEEISLCTNNILSKGHDTFIDIPLYYTSEKHSLTHVSKELLYLMTLKILKKNVK